MCWLHPGVKIIKKVDFTAMNTFLRNLNVASHFKLGSYECNVSSILTLTVMSGAAELMEQQQLKITIASNIRNFMMLARSFVVASFCLLSKINFHRSR